MEDTDKISTEIFIRIRQDYGELASSISPFGNIFAAFFHDLVVHFTGIIIHRNTVGDYEERVPFPWVNREYALKPFELGPAMFPQQNGSSGLKELVRSIGLVPVAAGQSIPVGSDSGLFTEKILKILMPVSKNERVFIPEYDTQEDKLKHLVFQICHEYEIPNGSDIWKNWAQHLSLHTTRVQKSLSIRGALLGTRNNLQNRKLALNFLQQDKQVVGFTHGELSNHVFDEPVYSYSDRTLCTTLIEYGDFSPECISHPPIIAPEKEICRNSQLVQKYFSPSSAITPVNLAHARVLLIPTIYQQNHLYGPKRSYETLKYYEWHKTLEACIPNLTVKVHPKTRFSPKFFQPTESRPLEQCIPEYDLLVFDFIASGVALALFSDKPVIYFDIGLRTINPQFKSELEDRGPIYEIDFNQDWDAQVRQALDSLEKSNRTFSNLGLAKYSLTEKSEYGIGRTIFDIMYG